MAPTKPRASLLDRIKTVHPLKVERVHLLGPDGTPSAVEFDVHELPMGTRTAIGEACTEYLPAGPDGEERTKMNLDKFYRMIVQASVKDCETGEAICTDIADLDTLSKPALSQLVEDALRMSGIGQVKAKDGDAAGNAAGGASAPGVASSTTSPTN